jgi:formylmethanofuran dehydrogenase subunit E
MSENIRKCVKCHEEISDTKDPHYKDFLLCEICYNKTER